MTTLFPSSLHHYQYYNTNHHYHHTATTRAFSSAVAKVDEESSSHKEDDSPAVRRRKLILRRKRLKERRKTQQRRLAVKQNLKQQQTAVDLPSHSKEAIVEFSAHLMRVFASKQLFEVFTKLSSSHDKNGTLPFVTLLTTLLNSTNPNQLAQLSILEFLLNTERSTLVASKKKAGAHATENSVEETPLETFTADVETIMLARQRAVETGLQWSKVDRNKVTDTSREAKQTWLQEKSPQVQRHEAQEFASFLRSNMPTKKFETTMKLFEMYVGRESEKTSDLAIATAATTADDESVDETDDEHEDGESATAEATAKAYSMRILSSHLAQRTGTHFYLVAEQTASFFGMNDAAIQQGAKWKRAKQKWDKLVQRTINSLVDLQQKLIEPIASNVDDDDDDLSEKEIRQIKEDFLIDQAEQDLQIQPQAAIVAARGAGDLRFRRPNHYVYDTIQLYEDVRQDSQQIHSPPVDRMVFLDNLPIDVTEDYLIELYSRCGDVASVQIFNQRPDIDPGPLTPTKLRARRKKQMKSASSRARKWQRPRSPVYALLTFNGPEAYNACCIDELRIFGMIVQKHPMRSIRACDMRRLFIQNIPEKTFCTEFEQLLNELVNSSLFVSLGAGQNRRARIGSCEINFPSFELAFDSYNKLLESDLLQNSADCTVNWMKTPEDAELWWRRKRGFD